MRKRCKDIHSRLVETFGPKLPCPACRLGALDHDSEEVLRCVNCAQTFPMIEGVPLLFPSVNLPRYLRQDGERGGSGKLRRLSATGGAHYSYEYQNRDFLPLAAAAKEVLFLVGGDAGERPRLHERALETVAIDIVLSF